MSMKQVTIENVKKRILELERAGCISLNEERELDCLRQLVAMVAENAVLKEACGGDGSYRNCPACNHSEYIEAPENPATDAAIAALRAESRKEGAIFSANRILAAWDAGFVKDTPENAADIARAILTSTEFMDDAPEGDFDRSFADEMLKDIAAQIRSQPASHAPLSAAITDIIAERQRQQAVEGWSPEHDDTHDKAEMVFAAISYLMAVVNPNASHGWWPWDAAWWKPTNPRRDLVKAGALIAAEIERIDRQSVQVKGINNGYRNHRTHERDW